LGWRCVVRRRRWLWGCNRAADRANSAADQCACRGTATTAGDSADGGTGTRAEQSAAEGALPWVVGVCAGGQSQSHAECRGNRCNQTMHDSAISFSSVAVLPAIYRIVMPNDTPGE